MRNLSKMFIICPLLISTAGMATESSGGPITPDASPGSTSVMGGGTPGNEGLESMDATSRMKRENKKQQQQDVSEDKNYTDSGLQEGTRRKEKTDN
jgi:hypothetical protein